MWILIYKFLVKVALPSHNKSYALHSLSLVRATPHRAKGRATSHKKNVVRHRNKNFDPASVPGKAKAKEFKRINAFYQTPNIGLN
ncbi:MAG: hypothetical protein BWY03_00616 [Parcubacteria group bacterium ADurb.Bin159]|nr:MAG: hypothetical protein BWY03_00616 [Parcubacteria group bacterium ADurb.Bin159]